MVTKKSRFGRPVELNYAAMIYSLVARISERIPFIKDLVKRLRNDMIFRLDCGFLVSDIVPSEAAYSRIVTILSESEVLEGAKNTILNQAITEGFINDDTAALNASHFEAKDQAPPKEEKTTSEPKKRGRKSKEEREKWLVEQAEREVNLPLYEKKIEEQLDVSLKTLRYTTMDAGYDYEPIYEQVHRLGLQSVIAYNKRNEPEPIGFDKHFAPTCFREHSYRYDSYDAKYETLKYTRPKECKDCPLADQGICQKVYKVKITTDLRKYTAPARGSKTWKTIFKRRTAVERVNAYLKEYFQLNNVRYRTGKRAKVHFDLVTLVYNASKLAADRMNAMLNQRQAA